MVPNTDSLCFSQVAKAVAAVLKEAPKKPAAGQPKKPAAAQPKKPAASDAKKAAAKK